MVKFTLQTIEENVNISKVSPKREFVVLSLGLLGIILFIYITLGLALDRLIISMPYKVDQMAAKLFQFKGFETSEKFIEAQRAAQTLLDQLSAKLPDNHLEYTLYIVNSEEVNALALPGGHIILLSGLLSEIESENELAMVLGHELGHYANHDHLRGLGRGIVFMVAATVLFGTDSGVTNMVSSALSTVEMKFSRTQESAADLFALDLLNKQYGHVAGATDFFERIEKKRDLPRFIAMFLTHPMGQKRVDSLNQTVVDLHYRVEDKRPLDAVFKNSDTVTF